MREMKCCVNQLPMRDLICSSLYPVGELPDQYDLLSEVRAREISKLPVNLIYEFEPVQIGSNTFRNFGTPKPDMLNFELNLSLV